MGVQTGCCDNNCSLVQAARTDRPPTNASMTRIDSKIARVDPDAIAEDQHLSTARKIEILKNWEYDAREILVADEEGFPAQQPTAGFDAIIAALHKLGAGPDLENTPPTKQGGV